jgi:pimeloyl-ACP methyl ester carboxylesterase
MMQSNFSKLAKHGSFYKQVLLFFCSGLLFIPGAFPQATPQKANAGSTETATIERPAFHEDWTELSMKGSTLEFKAPILAETDDIPHTGFIRERYQITWRPKDPFDLYVIRPRGVAKAPVILYLYSFPDDTDSFKSNDWCETAVSGGYAAVGFVGALTGHRLRFRLLKESLISEMQEALASSVHDVQLVLDYVATRKDLDVDRVAMFGVGSGGAIATLASATDPRIRALDLMGPWGDWSTWYAEAKIIVEADRPTFTKPEFLAKVAPLDPVSWLPKSKAKAIRIQDIRGNLSMPDKAQEKLEAAAPDFAVISEFGNGRAFFAQNQPAANLFQWAKDQLKSDAPAVQATKAERVHFYPALQAPAQNWPNVGTLDNSKAGAVASSKDANTKDKPKDN